MQLSSKHSQKLELVKIHSLHTQLVAGTNYKFVLDVANEQNEKLTYEATVYGVPFTCAGRAAWYSVWGCSSLYRHMLHIFAPYAEQPQRT